MSKRIKLIEKQFPDALGASSFSELPQIVSQKLEEKQQNASSQSNNYKSAPIDSSKAGSIQNIEDLEAYANQVAKPFLEEAESVDSSPATFNPEIEIEPADPYLSDSYGRQLCIQGYSRQNREHGDELLDHSISILGDLIESWDILHSYELICLLKSCLTFKISWTEYPRELTM